jgi:DNA-nicking Smr family endonuclease
MTADDKPRRRNISDEDRALWHSVARSVMPLKRRRAAPLAAASTEKHGKAAPARRAPATAPAPVSAPPPLKAPPLMPIDRRLKQRLARGLVEIDARLDLHGRTQSEAHAALLRFLHRAQGDGGRIVLVITGKGGESSGGRGVLNRQVPLWLRLPEFRAYVLGVEAAHAAHGGAGALYVRLRRGR